MTGIDRLRTLAGEWDAWGLGGALNDVADQIEREHACDADAIENVRLIVGGVVDEMERHVLGHEGAEDSPVARWVRELRDALGGDEHDVADDRDAIAWVREHGGIEHVRQQWGHLRGRANHADHVDRQLAKRQRQIDESHAALRRRNERIAFLVSELNRAHNENHEEFMRRAGDYTAFADEVCNRLAPELRYMEGCSKDVMDAALNALDRRLMPEGMEWPMVDGKPVDFRTHYEPSLGVLEAVSIYSTGACEVMSHDGIIKGISEIHIAKPKVLDADGVEIRVGDRPYRVDNGKQVEIRRIDPSYSEACVFVGVDGMSYGYWLRPDQLTHERPDSWERLEEDATVSPEAYCAKRGIDFSDVDGQHRVLDEVTERMARDLVRRAKKLAGDA